MALPLQNISFSFPCLTKDCITGRLRNAALPESPASSGKPQKTLAPADPPGVWTSKTGAGRSGRSFPGRKLSEPTLNWVLSRQCLYLLHYLFFSKDKSGSGSQRSSRGVPVMNIATQVLSSLVWGTSLVEQVCVNGLSPETVWDPHSSKHSATLWERIRWPCPWTLGLR